MDQSATEIIRQLLTEAGVPEPSIAWRLTEAPHRRAQCVQYAESQWAFVERLLCDEGINYWFESADDSETVIVLADHPAAHDPIAGDGRLRFQDAGGMAHSASSLFAFSRSLRMTHEAVHVADYDVEQPDLLIEGKAGKGALEHYEYPAWVPDAAFAARRAKVRLEQLQRWAERATGQSHSARLTPGRLVTVEGIADSELNGDYLITKVGHELLQPRDESEARHYRNQIELVAHDGERCHRPALPSGRPCIAGIESAQVAGPAGTEIHVAELGEVKLRLPWDRSGIEDDTASCWARSMQLNMDGSMMLPRIGWEVSVAYRDGSPDQPLVLAKLYNGTATVPYPLPENQATASLMSGTSPGGGSVNEVRLVDDAGKQQFGVQASGDQGVTVGGNLTTTVAVDDKHSVKGNLTESVKGGQTLFVAADQTVTVGSGCMTKVAGGRSVSVGGVEKIGVDLSYALDCAGGYGEVVGGLHFVRCNQSNDTLKAGLVQNIGGAMVITAASGVNEQVVGGRKEVCGGARTVAAGQMEDKAYGIKTLTTGASSLSVGGDLKTTAKSSATISAAAVSIKAGETVVLGTGSDVVINAPAIKIGGYRLAGVHKVSGDVDLDNTSTTCGSGTKAKS
ncbi:MAG: type VI secretion system tip protein VgrG [Deltaproteobacteria bacterium]|nr:MAG: type VI secretion system tip protein VgrG [Deltaproteobacteria bacterium]